MAGQTIRVGGWVKTGRTAGGGAFAFLELNDGSCFANMQVMVDKEVGDAVGGLKEMTSHGDVRARRGAAGRNPRGHQAEGMEVACSFAVVYFCARETVI